jgi:hypothetical protein
VADSLASQRLVIATGFIVVAVGFGGEIVAGEYHSGSLNSGYEIFFGVAFTLAYGILAWATWALFTWLEVNRASVMGLGRVLRLFSIANLVFAIGMISVAYFWADRAINLPYDGRLSIAIPTTEGLQLFGFCLVSAGFWAAASRLGRDARQEPTSGESAAAGMTDLEVPI